MYFNEKSLPLLTLRSYSRILVDIHGLTDCWLDEVQLERNFLHLFAESIFFEDRMLPVQSMADLSMLKISYYFIKNTPLN